MVEVSGPIKLQKSNENAIALCSICVTKVCGVFLLVHCNQLSQYPKRYKKQKLGNKMDGDIEDSRLCKAQTGQKTEKSS